ncbi:MAG: hypothetical protein JO149_03260 [Gammaproteobacteria bacterium]|nr:hypothetical protein [Gammaproteobacteria bacterium]
MTTPILDSVPEEKSVASSEIEVEEKRKRSTSLKSVVRKLSSTHKKTVSKDKTHKQGSQEKTHASLRFFGEIPHHAEQKNKFEHPPSVSAKLRKF